MPLPPDAGAPPHWLAYFTTADLDARRRPDTGARRLGSSSRPRPIPAGRFLVASDPQGAVFALFEGEVDP